MWNAKMLAEHLSSQRFFAYFRFVRIYTFVRSFVLSAIFFVYTHAHTHKYNDIHHIKRVNNSGAMSARLWNTRNFVVVSVHYGQQMGSAHFFGVKSWNSDTVYTRGSLVAAYVLKTPEKLFNSNKNKYQLLLWYWPVFFSPIRKLTQTSAFSTSTTHIFFLMKYRI